MLDELAQLGKDLIGLIPEVALFLLVLVVGLVVASLVKRGLDALLTRVRASGWVERLSTRAIDKPIKIDVAEILSTVVYWVLVLLTLYFAFGVFGKETVIALFLGGLIFTLLPKMLVAVVLVILAVAIAGAVKGIIRDALGNSGLGRNLGMAASVVIIVLGVIAALAQVDIAVPVVIPMLWAILAILVISFGIGGIPVARELLERAVRATEATVEAPVVDEPVEVVTSARARRKTAPKN